jgi:two-component system, cell cycle sensor histidine kinase PleC
MSARKSQLIAFTSDTDVDDIAILRRERDAARHMMQEVRAERELFLANLSHEMRTPLTALLGYTDLLEMILPPNSHTKQQDYLNAMRAAGGHLSDVLDSILNVARFRAGGLTLSETRIHISDIVTSALQLVKLLADAQETQLVVRYAPNIPDIIADAQLLRQILVNLLSNAIKVSPRGADIVILVKIAHNNQLQIIIRDHGQGMDAHTIEKVMRPFAQAVQATGFGAAGTGLGLALVRSMVELHDGNFQLVSHVGHGTRAIVSLPTARICKPPQPGQQHEFTFVRSGTQPL